MRLPIAIPILVFGMHGLHAQRMVQAGDVPCADDHTTRVTQLHVDSLCSSAMICIPGEVPAHYHARHTEHVHVLDGRGLLMLAGDTLQLRPGDVVVIPAGTPHAAWSKGEVPLRVISIHAPPFDGLDRMPWEPGMRTGSEPPGSE
jgi:mannose-6-phosphate isomerase-like protein (cupin superfamily)